MSVVAFLLMFHRFTAVCAHPAIEVCLYRATYLICFSLREIETDLRARKELPALGFWKELYIKGG
jgi:hypothetical protein